MLTVLGLISKLQSPGVTTLCLVQLGIVLNLTYSSVLVLLLPLYVKIVTK